MGTGTDCHLISTIWLWFDSNPSIVDSLGTMKSSSQNPFLLCEATNEKHELAHEFTIGRSLSSSLVLEDNNRVSRNHGAFNLENGIFHYVDLNSANGSWIGINRLEPGRPYALKHGAVIKVAGRQFTFCEREDPNLFDRTVLT